MVDPIPPANITRCSKCAFIRKLVIPVIQHDTVSMAEGVPFFYQIVATPSFGITEYQCASGFLLDYGLSFDSATGIISGTPSGVTGGQIIDVDINAVNAKGTGLGHLTVNTLEPYPVITSPTTSDIGNGAAFSYQITATNTPTLFGATGLPSGLSINTSTGLITGTITGVTVGTTYTIGLSATNSGGTGIATLTLTVIGSMVVVFSAFEGLPIVPTATIALDGGSPQAIVFGTSYGFVSSMVTSTARSGVTDSGLQGTFTSHGSNTIQNTSSNTVTLTNSVTVWSFQSVPDSLNTYFNGFELGASGGGNFTQTAGGGPYTIPNNGSFIWTLDYEGGSSAFVGSSSLTINI